MRDLIQAKQYRGFTALELIIVLVVGFSIIALSASKMGQLFSSSSTASAMTSILDLYTSARSLRGATGYGSDGTDLMEPLVKAKMIPKGLTVVGTIAKNEWNGDIAIKVTASGLGFDLTYPKVPADACSKITQNLLKSGSFMEIKVGTASDGLKVDSTVTEVVTACAGDGSGNGVDMTFMFRE